MKANRIYVAAAAVAIASVAMVGCKKKEAEAPVAPVAVAPTASVTAVDFGTAAGSDSKISTAATSFKATDTVIASVATTTSDAMATVPSTVGAKVSFNGSEVPGTAQNSQVNLSGSNNTAFKWTAPAKGWPVGTYNVDVSLNGAVVQSKTFEVK